MLRLGLVLQLSNRWLDNCLGTKLAVAHFKVQAPTLEGGNQTPEGGKQRPEGGKRDLPPLPINLVEKLPAPGQRMGEAASRQLICDLCEWQPLRGEELAILLGKDLKYLRNKHLSAMIQAGKLAFQYPESPNHALQAYKIPKDQ